MKVTVDFEARSAAKLSGQGNVGAWRYSEDPTTDVLCMALKVEDRPPVVWIAPWVLQIFENTRAPIPDDLRDRSIDSAEVMSILEAAEQVEAHNAGFEQAMWTNVMAKRYGWAEVPLEKWRCSMAKCLLHALPAALGQACAVLGVEQQKDDAGKKTMLKLCKPRNPLKSDKVTMLTALGFADAASMKVAELDNALDTADPSWRERHHWNEDPADLVAVIRYCMQDAEAEHALSEALRDLPPQEIEVWQYDQRINRRGVKIDLGRVEALRDAVRANKARMLAEAANYGLRNANSDIQFVDWMHDNGVSVPDATKGTLASLLKTNLPPVVRRIVEIRKSVAMASTSKLDAMLRCAGAGGRVRGIYIYHKAATGRWAGAMVQGQNLPRKTLKNIEEYTDLLGADIELAELFFGDTTECASKCIRGMFVPEEGHDFVCADYNAIEGRGLAWLAGDDTALDVYRKGRDPYIAAAAMVTGKSYEFLVEKGKVDDPEEGKPKERQMGKVVELACGYQGSVGAARQFGAEGTDEEILNNYIYPWRAARKATVEFWYAIERVAIQAVKNPGRVFEYRGIRYMQKGRFLLCRLPSGRLLHYYQPLTQTGEGRYPDKEVLTYMGMKQVQGTTTTKWCRVATYGGKLVENITQAVCRDVMAYAMPRVERSGYPIVMHTHDELVTEVPEGFGSVEELAELMTVAPPWARDLPLKASGWRGKRYRK